MYSSSSALQEWKEGVLLGNEKELTWGDAWSVAKAQLGDGSKG